MPKKRLFLIDGNNVAYRAFFALPVEIATSGGFPTNALYGFCLMIIKILTEYRPAAVIVVTNRAGAPGREAWRTHHSMTMGTSRSDASRIFSGRRKRSIMMPLVPRRVSARMS